MRYRDKGNFPFYNFTKVMSTKGKTVEGKKGVERQ